MAVSSDPCLRSGRPAPRAGFTLIEIMVVVAIIGVLVTIAVPLLQRYQLRAKSAEVRTNLAAIHVVEDAWYSERGGYLAAAPEPPVVPGSQRANFNAGAGGFSELGWQPESDVYFSYGVAVNTELSGFTADGAADLDGNGIVQFWGYAKPGPGGVKGPAAVGCDVAGLGIEQVGPCNAGAGNSIF